MKRSGLGIAAALGGSAAVWACSAAAETAYAAESTSGSFLKLLTDDGVDYTLAFRRRNRIGAGADVESDLGARACRHVRVLPSPSVYAPSVYARRVAVPGLAVRRVVVPSAGHFSCSSHRGALLARPA